MAINVNSVYRTVLTILNKEERGTLTPDAYNRLARQAQIDEVNAILAQEIEIEVNPITTDIYPDNISAPISLFEFNSQDLVVSFNDLSNIINEDEIILWEWNFGDGSQSYISSPQHTYNDYGLYTVELVVMSEFGLYSDVHIENINIINQLYDINNDNNIDVLDVVELISVILDNAFNEYIEEYDINLDFQVNILDVIILVQSIIS